MTIGKWVWSKNILKIPDKFPIQLIINSGATETKHLEAINNINIDAAAASNIFIFLSYLIQKLKKN